jgi:hypothetical protein
MPGPAPKDPTKLQRERDARRALERWVDLGEREPFEIPELLAGEHRPETLRWFAAWRDDSAAHARLSSPTDWGRLVMLADLVDLYFASVERGDPDLACMREIRLSEAKLGGTFIDRARIARRTPP